MLLTSTLPDQLFDHYIEEEFLVNQVEQLESSEILDRSIEIYWLSMARVMELALLCAGNYADFGQIREAGALLVNPRHTEIHINGLWEPIIVKRYKRITEQFADYAPAGIHVTKWLRDNTHLVHVKGPLLPDLHNKLKESNVLSKSYLSSVSRRMQKISETMTFVMIGQLTDPNFPFSGVHPEEKEFVEANLCRYNKKQYHQIGADIAEMVENVNYCSPFVGESATSSSA